MDLKGAEAQEAALYRDAITDNGTVRADDEMLGTESDQRDMYRLGKVQRLRRNFSFFSIFGFSMLLLSTWESVLGVAAFGLMNGGTGGLLYMYISTWIGYFAVVCSMAEMASMAPTAGGQYHWVSEFAPRNAQRFLSYIVGWLCVIGWQSGAASSAFLAGTEIQGLIVLNHLDTYHFERWHGTLLVFAIAIICCIFNTVLARRLPMFEGVAVTIHIMGFFAIMITLLVLAPKSSSHEVWTVFTDGASWGNNGLACLVGILAPAVSLLGSDAAAHMSEELKDAGHTLPRAMLTTLGVNGLLGFGMLITFVYTVGDVESVVSTPTGYPFIQVFANGTGSIGGATGMTAVLILLSVFGALTNVASASRQLFAFARDHGVPFSGFFSYVPPGWDIPLNCILTTTTIQILLSLINIGSVIAFNQIVSWGVTALLTSYMISIGCITLKRLRHEPLLPSSFSLGRAGLATNIFSLLFLTLALIFCFFPPQPDPKPDTMNWSILMYGGVIIIALLWFFFRARKVYVGPVEYVRKNI